MEGHGGGGRQVESKLSPGDSVWDPQEDRRVAAQVRSRGGHHDDGRAKGLGADGGGGGGVDCCGDGRGSFGQIQTSDLHHAKGNATEAAALWKGFVLHADRAEPMFPPRPGYGAAGTPCVVRANLFFSRLADQGVHYYSLTISPEPTFKYDYGEVMSKLVLEHQHTDLGGRLTTCNGSSSLITLGKLPFDTKEFEVALSGDKGKETNYRVVVKHVMAISLLQLRMLLGCYPRDIQDMEPMQNDLSVSLDMPAAGFIHPLLPSDFFEKALNIHNSDRKLAIAEDVKEEGLVHIISSPDPTLCESFQHWVCPFS